MIKYTHCVLEKTNNNNKPTKTKTEKLSGLNSRFKEVKRKQIKSYEII